MKPSLLLLALLGAIGLSACAVAEDDTYPVSGEQCGPEDSVQELDAADCLPPGGASAGVF